MMDILSFVSVEMALVFSGVTICRCVGSTAGSFACRKNKNQNDKNKCPSFSEH